MRILMYCPFFPPQYSGAAKQAIALAIQLRRLSHTIEFLTMGDAGLPVFEVCEGFSVHRLDIHGRRNHEMPFWEKFFTFAFRNRRRFDVLHSHGAHYLSSIVGPISKVVGWRSIVKATMSNDDLHGLKKSTTGILHYIFLKSANAYVAISQDLVREFEAKGFPKKRIYHIPNGVDTDRFRPPEGNEKEELRKALNLPLSKLIFLSVGVFDDRKNLGWLIKEWNKENGSDRQHFLLAIGPQSREDLSGSFLNSLSKIAARRRENMRIINYVDNIERYFRAADVFLLPSTNEGLPNVILEAMATGLPCIATRSAGTKDLVAEGKTGFLYSTNNSTELSNTIGQLTKNQMVTMGQNARHRVQSEYSIDKIAHVYSELYQKL